MEVERSTPANGARTETGRVRTNDVDTYYVRRGDGPPVVFVHGMATSTAQWDSQMDALSEYTTIAYDVRGHGRTGGSNRESYDVELYASDLHALLEALNVERPLICGLSMGGCIAQVYAARHPENVAGVVLADTFSADELSFGARLLFANLRLLGRLDGLVRYTTLNRLQTRVGNRLSPGVAGDGTAIQRVMETGPKIPHAEFVKIADSVAAFPDSDFDVTEITAPTLVLYGEHNPDVLVEMHERLAARLTNAEVSVRVVPAAGHASNVDNPAFFTDAVRRFARRVFEPND